MVKNNMLDFKTLKVGDVVPIKKLVRYGFGQGREFWIQGSVTGATKAQITLSDGRRVRRDSKKVIGGDEYERYCPPCDIDYATEKAEYDDLKAKADALKAMASIGNYRPKIQEITPEIAAAALQLNALIKVAREGSK